MQSMETAPTYRSLADIRLRKAQLLTDITKDSNHVRHIWNGMFHSKKKAAQPKRRFAGLLATGAGVLDGALLVWKLYRKLGGTPAGALRLFKRK